MKQYKYLIVGGGMTADAAVQGIREVDLNGSIGVISEEPDGPYNRPPLTKGLWKDPATDISRKAASERADLHLGRRVNSVSLWKREVADDQGNAYGFEKLLLATGGRPRLGKFGSEEVIYYRTVADYRRLRKLTDKYERFAVIGGGFIGSELAASLARNHKQVVMLFPGQSIGNKMFPAELSNFLNEYYRQNGVELLPGERVAEVSGEREGRLTVKTESGKQREVEGVIAGLGIEPNVELAAQCGLRVDDGVVVDEFLCTSHPEVYAAGDVAVFYNPALARRLRVEHEDNANTMGQLAGRNMAGIPQAYTHLPFFYSDLFDLGYEAVGEVDSRHSVVADWKEPFREGTIWYHQDGRIRGVLLWNVWGRLDAARELINSKRRFSPGELNQDLLKAA